MSSSRTRIKVLQLALLLAASAVGFSGVAAAQATAQSTTAGTLGEVLVTARKFQENLQETPVAVTAFTGSELEDRQIFVADRLG